jgi:hypothetical protein
MSKLDRLVEAGLVDLEQVTDEQVMIIEEQLTEGEIDVLVTVQEKLGGQGTMHGVREVEGVTNAVFF